MRIAFKPKEPISVAVPQVPPAVAAEMLKVGLPMLVEAAKQIKASKSAGRPSSGKKVVSLRLSEDVIAKFRATGKGWQARIDEALRKANP